MYKNRKVFFIISIISILVISAVCINMKDRMINDIVCIIVEGSENNPKYDKRVEKLALKKEKNLKDEEKLLLGYKAYKEGNFEVSKGYLRDAVSSKHNIVKLYSGRILIEILVSENNIDEFNGVLKDVLTNICRTVYNKHYEVILDIMLNAINIEEARETLQESLEQVVEDTRVLEDTIVYDLKSKLAVLYLTKGKYARGIEKCLEIISESEKKGDVFYAAKSYIDIGTTYNMLGDSTRGCEYIEKGMNISIADKEKEAHIKTYGALNLYDAILYEKNFEQVKHVQEILNKYSGLLDEQTQHLITVMNKLSLARIKIAMGELDGIAYELKNMEAEINKVQNIGYLGISTTYSLAQAELAHAEGKIEEAMAYYNKALEAGDRVFKKFALQEVVNMLNEVGEYKKSNSYYEQLQQWYEEEAEIVNKNYSDYALYKYEYERKLKEDSDREIKVHIVIGILIMLASGSILMLSLRRIHLIRLNKLDGLTKIYNRSYFEKCYSALITQEKHFVIIIFDIDHFKLINDTYGHAVGDKVIQKVVELSQKTINKRGTLFRYGGEEFAVISESLSLEEAVMLAEQIRKAVAAYSWQGIETVTVSLGLAASGANLSDVLNKADQNLYEAKIQGRNQVVYHKMGGGVK